jgi:hypothetical protein
LRDVHRLLDRILAAAHHVLGGQPRATSQNELD